mmetsp:Transcript_34296/g.85420  ORF Transcript_34296/g.85420 Transcript_34296/m.85420 type:complete len:250 (+) Transcript_34296:388-1137(+)
MRPSPARTRRPSPRLQAHGRHPRPRRMRAQRRDVLPIWLPATSARSSRRRARRAARTAPQRLGRWSPAFSSSSAPNRPRTSRRWSQRARWQTSSHSSSRSSAKGSMRPSSGSSASPEHDIAQAIFAISRQPNSEIFSPALRAIAGSRVAADGWPRRERPFAVAASCAGRILCMLLSSIWHIRSIVLACARRSCRFCSLGSVITTRLSRCHAVQRLDALNLPRECASTIAKRLVASSASLSCSFTDSLKT